MTRARHWGLAPLSAGVLAVVVDPDQFAIEIHEAGYATSSTFAQNLIALMHQFNLYQYDRLL
jgi:flagellum-specific peptidoglycan hydrolase FlgJ